MNNDEKELLNKFLVWMWDYNLTHIVERRDRIDVIDKFEKILEIVKEREHSE